MEPWQDSVVKCISISAPNVRTTWDKENEELQVSSGQIVLPNEFFKNLQFSELFYILKLQIRDARPASFLLSLLFIVSFPN